MGWADCGKDRGGRDIGYAFEAVCDAPNCNEKIHRGLSYACGGMHGEDEVSCEKYFCGKHLIIVETKPDGPTAYAGQHTFSVCAGCEQILRQEDCLVDE
jgi:hypothetical protein